METYEPSCVPRATNPFFIHVVYNPLRAIGHVVAPELPLRGVRAWSHGTCGNAGAYLSREMRSGAEGHVAAPELTSTKR
jgi:hypothetical protein